MVSSTGRALPLLGTVLAADAEGGVARVTLEQRFRNPHHEPLAVTYSLPLPADGAVSGFSFVIGDRRVVGVVDRKRAARERYEQALIEGKSAALLEQDRSSLFTQEIGNIPPGAEVVVEVSVDQRLSWLDEGAWEWRFPTVVAPRYLGEPGRVADAAKVVQDVADGPLPARFAIACTVHDRLADGRRPESPSHALDVSLGEGGARIELRDRAGARLDRDLVVRWQVATPRMGLTLATGRLTGSREVANLSYGLLTVVPPSIEGSYRSVPRDLIVLLDTSGSMHGEPLAQAAAVVSAIVETLRDQDRIELIEFGSAPRRWKAQAVSATESARREAIAWLHALRASGGTEMRSAIVEALSGTRAGAQRQVVLVTDGLIGFESQVVAAIRDRLPASSRLHTVGVGSSVNRSLTGPAARAGHGVEVVIGLGEDPERAASRIVARTSAPLLVDLALSGSALAEHAPEKLPDLFARAPALISVRLRPEGGELVVRGRTPEGSWEQRLRVGPEHEIHGNPGIAALFGREKVEDLEMALAAGQSARDIDASIEQVGLGYQISTRLTSWIAVSEEVTVDPGEPWRRERMPHELPHGMSAEGLGLRPVMAEATMGPGLAMPAAFAASGGAPPPPPMPARPGAPMTRTRAVGQREEAKEARESRRASVPPSEAPLGKKLDAAGDRITPHQAAPPPAPASKAKGRGGLIGAIKDFFSDEADDAPASPPPTPEPERASKPKPHKAAKAEAEEVENKPVASRPERADDAGGRVLRGRVALHRDGLLIVEVAAGAAPIAWGSPALTAKIVFASGREITVALDKTRSTRAGTVAAGALARLALTLPAGDTIEGEDVLRVTIELGGDMVVIELG